MHVFARKNIVFCTQQLLMLVMFVFNGVFAPKTDADADVPHRRFSFKYTYNSSY
jgi:hypothetical protein